MDLTESFANLRKKNVELTGQRNNKKLLID